MSLFENNQEIVFTFDPAPVTYGFPIEFNMNDKNMDYEYPCDEIYPKMNNNCKQSKSTYENTSNDDSTYEMYCNAASNSKLNIELADNNKETDSWTDESQPIVVPFEGENPKICELERIINDQITKKGYNNVVLDCLELYSDDECDADNYDIIRKKQQKTKGQIKGLKSEFKKRPNWNKRSMKKLAKELGLTASQVYKWHWDQTNKMVKKSAGQSSRWKTTAVPCKRFKSEE